MENQPMPTLSEKELAVEDALKRAGIPYESTTMALGMGPNGNKFRISATARQLYDLFAMLQEAERIRCNQRAGAAANDSLVHVELKQLDHTSDLSPGGLIVMKPRRHPDEEKWDGFGCTPPAP